MTWTVELDDRAVKDLDRLERESRRRILRFLRERIATDESPKRLGRPLTGPKLGLWRYRVGDYRIVCRIESDRVVVLVVAIGHRKNIYR